MMRPPARRTAARSKAATALIGVLLLLLGTLVATPAQAAPPVATGMVKTADLTKFQPGNIIADAVFYNASTMSEAQIQSFLNGKVPTCRSGYVCLKSKTDTTRSIGADAMCNAYAGGGVESAARIIFKVAQACGINPQALIVMLQKEQGLVTDTYPYDSQYRIAMGQGCPDTAACDSRYFGFFNQVHGAAWQLKRYGNPPGTSNYFNWYAPGKTWNLRWHPNASCGSSPVYIANQATSALYYYTPYQPNPAALRAGYGEGDGCSSYGNRNFYQYFTDWFGSTQTGRSVLVKAGAEVSILTGDRRYGITAEAYPEYKRIFGAPAVVDATFLALYRHAGNASFYVKNAGTGEVAMLQGGQVHPFPSCGLVGAWGGACGAALVQLEPREYNAFGKGAVVTAFARTQDGGKIHQIVGATLQPYFDGAAAAAANGGTTPYAAVMRASVSAGYELVQRQLFTPARWILRSGDPTVWLPTTDGRLIGLPSWSLAAELGLPTSVTSQVTAADTTGYSTTEILSQYVGCNGKTYFAASGGLHEIKSGPPAGFAVTTLDAATCGRLDLGRAAFAAAAFVKTAGSGTVYRADGGVYRPIPSGAKMIELNGGTRPPVAVVSEASLARYAMGPLYLETGRFVRADGDASVYYVDGDRLLGLPSWGLARAWGLSSTVRIVSPSDLAGLQVAGAMTHFVRCAGTLYAAGGDILSKVNSGDAAGNAVTDLSDATCQTLRLTGPAVTGPVFVTDGSRTAVATAGGFLRLPDAASILRANGGKAPASKWVTAAYFTALPQPTQLPVAGDLVRAADASSVTLVDGGKRLGIPNWGVAADLGVQPRYRILPAATLATITVSPEAVGVVVRCAGTDYVAARGVLSPLTPAGLAGVRPTTLSEATCATLDRTGGAIAGPLFVRAAGSAQVYVMSNARLRALAAGETPAALNGGVEPRILEMDPRTVAGLTAR